MNIQLRTGQILRFKRGSMGVVEADAAFFLQNAQWVLSERPEDANTRRLRIVVNRNPPLGKKYVWWRGQSETGLPTSGTFGAFTLIAPNTWEALAANASPLGGFDYVSVIIVDVAASATPSWNVSPQELISSVKRFDGYSGVPVQPELSFTIDGTGTAAFVSPETPEGNGRPVTGYRYTIDGGTAFDVDGVADLALTALTGPVLVTWRWRNANGLSVPTEVTVTPSMPTFGVNDWNFVDAVAVGGGVLRFNILNAVTPPVDRTIVSVEFQIRTTGPYSDPVVLPTPGLVNSVGATEGRIRPVYDVGPGPWSDVKTQTATAAPVPGVGEFPVIAASGTVFSGVAPSLTSHAIDLPPHQPGDLIFVALGVANSGNLIPQLGWTYNFPVAGNSYPRFLYKFAQTNDERLTITLDVGRKISPVPYVIRGSRLPVFGSLATVTSLAALDPPALSIGVSASALWMAVAGLSGTSTFLTGSPSGWSERVFRSTGSSASDTRIVTAFLASETASLDPPVFTPNTTNAAAMTVAFPPGVEAIEPSVIVSTAQVGIAAAGELLLFTRAEFYGFPVPAKTYTIQRTNNGGASFETVTSIYEDAVYLDASAVGWQYRLREVATNAHGSVTSDSPLSAIVAATANLLPIQTIVRGAMTVTLGGVRSHGLTADGQIAAVAAATHISVLSVTPGLSYSPITPPPTASGTGGHAYSGYEINPLEASDPEQGFDERHYFFNTNTNRMVRTANLNYRTSLQGRIPARLLVGDRFVKTIGFEIDKTGRAGLMASWHAIFAMATLPGANSYAPCVWEFTGRNAGYVEIDVAAWLANKTTYNFPPRYGYVLETEIVRNERFEPSFGRFRNASGPSLYESMFCNDPGLNGAGGYSEQPARLHGVLALEMVNANVSISDRLRIARSLISKGIQWDTPHDIPADGGHGQHFQVPITLSRSARGVERASLAITKQGSWFGQIFQFTQADIEKLVPGPISDSTVPRMYRQRTVVEVGVTPGGLPRVRLAKATSETGGMQLLAMNVVRASDGASATVLSGGIGHNSNANGFWVNIDVQPATPFAVNNVLHFEVPLPRTVGLPDWAIRYTGVSAMGGYSASEEATYRTKQRWMGGYMALHALGIACPEWTALKAYMEALQSKAYPTSGDWRYTRRLETEWVADCIDAFWPTIRLVPQT